MGSRTNARRAHNIKTNGSRARFLAPKKGTSGYSQRTARRKIHRLLSRGR